MQCSGACSGARRRWQCGSSLTPQHVFVVRAMLRPSAALVPATNCSKHAQFVVLNTQRVSIELRERDSRVYGRPTPAGPQQGRLWSPAHGGEQHREGITGVLPAFLLPVVDR